MKSSLKFTAIALLLGGVLHVQNLNAATHLAGGGIIHLAVGGNIDSEAYGHPKVKAIYERLANGVPFSSDTSDSQFIADKKFFKENLMAALGMTRPASVVVSSSSASEKPLSPAQIAEALMPEILRSSVPPIIFKEILSSSDGALKPTLNILLGILKVRSVLQEVIQERDTLAVRLATKEEGQTLVKSSLKELQGAHDFLQCQADQLPSKLAELQKRKDEVSSLQDDVNQLSDCIVELQQAAQTPEVRAFLPLTGPSVITPVEELAAYTVVASKPSNLPLAEQMYLLKVRENLGDPVRLGASLTQLDTLMQFVRNIASDVRTPESLARSALLRDIIPQVQGITPIIGGYMQSILGQIAAINTDVHSRRGYFVSGTPTPIQTLQLSELDARKNLAYSVFDAIFGAMTKPASVPASVDFRADQSPANVLTSKVQTLHTTLPLTVSSSAIVVKNDGSIATIKEADFLTGIDLSSEYMVSIRTATAELLGQVLGAQTLVRGTFATSSVTGFSELVEAKASLLLPPALLATVQVATASNANHLNTSSHSEGGVLVDDAAIGTKAITTEEVTA